MAGQIAVIDTETTGLCPIEHRIWEAALVLYDCGDREIIAEHAWQLELSPDELAAADPEAMRIGRFEERRLPPDQLVPRWLFAEQIVALTTGIPLVGANPSFDEERVRRLAWSCGLEPSWHYRPICVEALAVGYLHGLAAGSAPWLASPADHVAPEAARRVPWGSTKVCEALGVARPQSEAHTALGDARWALAVWRKVTEG